MPWTHPEPPDDIWAWWPDCPRHHVATYAIDQGRGSLAELCRWAWERGIHRRRRLTAGGSWILREWSALRDRPAELAAHIESNRRPPPGAGG